MEALTALSIASSVITFVDFGSKLLSNSKKLYKAPNGALSSVVDIETITSDLMTLTQSLRRKLPEHRAPSDSLHASQEQVEDVEALDNLCIRSIEIAEELKRRLYKLKLNPKVPAVDQSETDQTTDGGSRRSKQYLKSHALFGTNGSKRGDEVRSRQFKRWDSFRKALEASWSKDEIEEMAATLREFRGEIEFRILVSFRYASHAPFSVNAQLKIS
jgi:hypothetical protein